MIRRICSAGFYHDGDKRDHMSVSGLDVALIVIGGVNTDITALGVDRILSPGELTRSGRLLIGPGGKSCNLARMAAPLLAPRGVFMIARTCRDPYGLWQVPLQALRDAGVNTDFVKEIDFEGTGEYPGVALIPVDKEGENQIYCLPGINDSFQPGDIEDASSLFDTTGDTGMLALTLEMPLDTAVHAARKAVSSGMKVVLDPGGMDALSDYGELLGLGLFILAPNEHEAGMLTGIGVEDMDSAREAARSLMDHGIENVVLTHGEKGAYVFGMEGEAHIPARRMRDADVADATGCGDQVTAVLCAEILRGKGVMEASELAVLAGTMQYHRPGIDPVTRYELERTMGGGD
jgi:ribokinase